MTSPSPSISAGSVSTPLLDHTIGAALDLAVRAFPEREALVDVPGGRRWTYRELSADARLLGGAGPDGGGDRRRRLDAHR
ncbi:hypothetical protein ACFWOG_33230 [Kitasatospora sp. NPDC058406]|uniref:hypothetical protein n=1 Tax=Kitasatospora sp. NPDC058406 TaxID=3346483 RepID=UPI0036691A64